MAADPRLLLVTLRPFRPADTPSLVALFRDTVRRVNRRHYSPRQLRAWAPDGPPDSADRDRWATLGGNFTVVAETAGAVVGFADLRADGWVDRVFVHAGHQRRGVGRLLLGALLMEARRRGLPAAWADVTLTARPLFRHCGFAAVAVQTATVRGVRIDHYCMAIALGGGR